MNDIAIKNQRRALVPACCITGDDNTVTLRIEMPGVRKDDIDVRVDGDLLTVTGKRPAGSASGEWLLRERSVGDFERSFTLDSSIDRERIGAAYELGVMTLTLQVKDEVKPRRIDISAR